MVKFYNENFIEIAVYLVFLRVKKSEVFFIHQLLLKPCLFN